MTTYVSHPSFPRYLIGDNTTIINSQTNRLMTPSLSGNGYYYLNLIDYRGVKVSISLHRLIALCFCHKPLGHIEVDHIDGRRDNNDFRNLRWVTPKMNAQNKRMVHPKPENQKRIMKRWCRWKSISKTFRNILF